MRINSSNHKATIDGIEYYWRGGFGSVLKSKERNVKLNDVRIINNIIFYAFNVECGFIFCNKTISWIPQQQIDAEWIRSFKKQVFIGE